MKRFERRRTRLHLLAVHPTSVPADHDAVSTVPLAHWEALIAFVDFRCHWALEVDEARTYQPLREGVLPNQTGLGRPLPEVRLP